MPREKKDEENHGIFDGVMMTLDRVLPKGKGKKAEEDKTGEAWAYVYLSTTLDPDLMKALKLERVVRSRWLKHSKQVPLAPEAFEFGAIFKVHMSATESRKVFINSDGASLISAHKVKMEVGFSILVRCKDWDAFGVMLDAVGETVRVTIKPGPKQLDLGVGEDENGDD